MTTACITPSRRLNWIYVFSALCMIFGLFATNGSLDFSPMPPGNIVLLIGVLNIYEFLTLGIAYLLHRKKIDLDAHTLLVIESLFLFDSAFLVSEIVTIWPHKGLLVAIALFAAAMVKLVTILNITNLKLLSRTTAMAVLMMMLICIIPSMFKSLSMVHAGKLSAENYYFGWWLASLAPLAAAWFWRRNLSGVMHAILWIGMVSLLAHISTESWVNRVEFSLANLSPFLLAMAVMIGNAKMLPMSLRNSIGWQLAIPVLAIFLSIRNDELMYWKLGQITITPLRLILLGTAGVYLHGLLRHRDWRFGAGLVGGLSIATAGSNINTITTNSVSTIRMIVDFINRMIPRTLIQWGWVSIAAAFGLLISGALQSIRRQHVVQPTMNTEANE